MHRCPACDRVNPDGHRFCGYCGAALASTDCPSCGGANPVGQAFCGSCGAALDAGPAASEAAAVRERKLATVLFADVVGFTSLAERTDPEVVANLVNTALGQLAGVVVEHGGTVDKYMGDALMATFGVPIAHDDDAERAVAAGLAMRGLQGDLAFSIGINSGEVMATPVGDAGDLTVIGDTVNVAARLEKAAGAGQVLCGHLTTELVGHRVRFREGRPVLLKGKREPVGAWEAVALRPVEVLPAAEETPLIGRDDELAFLEAQWRRAQRDRRSHVVLLSGDPGSGKTRLANELAARAASEASVIHVTCPAYGTTGGARVAAEIIRQLGPADDDEVNVRVRSLAGEVGPSLKAIDPAGLQQEQLWAFGRLLESKGTGQPLLLVIDDVHRSRDRILELIGALAGQLGDVTLLTALVGRSDPGEWLGRFPSATTVRLSPLSRPDAATLAGALVGDKPLDAEAVEFLVSRASGNPMYMRELVAVARAHGALVDQGDHYSLTGHAAVPASLQALLAARLDALGSDRKLAFQQVALIGEGATSEQVAAIGSARSAATLHSLVESGLLRQDRGGRYDTVDPLMREVAYEALPRNVRGSLHRAAADLVESGEDRARHLDLAASYLPDDDTLSAEAAEALAGAGETLIQDSRYLDALHLLERAAARGWRRTTDLIALAQVQALCGEQDQAVHTLESIPDDPYDPAVAVERDHAAANVKMMSDPAWSLPRLEAVARRWHALGNTTKEAWAHANVGVTLFYLSKMEESAAELLRGLELFERAGDRAGAVAATSFLCLAKPTDRRVPGWLTEALEYADAAGDRSKQLNILTTSTWHYFFRSFCGTAEAMTEAEGSARRLADLAESIHGTDVGVHAWSLLATMARFTGRFGDAASHLASFRRLAGQTRQHEPWLGWAASFGVALATGEPGAGAPFPPAGSTDPVVKASGLLVEAELVLAGRGDEVLSRGDGAARWSLGRISDVAGVLHALALLQAGRTGEAFAWAERAGDAARSLGAGAAAEAADSLVAEATGDTTALRSPPASANSVSEALVLRAHAARGDSSAMDRLRHASDRLVMPGLLKGLGAT